MKDPHKQVKIPLAPEKIGDRVRLKNTYMIEFMPDTAVTNHFQTIAESLKASHYIHHSAIKNRSIIHSTLFSGASFSLTVNPPNEAIEMIKGAIAIYAVYTVPAPNPLQHSISSNTLNRDSVDSINSHDLTGVTQVHEELHNFGKGVRVRKPRSY
jgi:hypothetical protein